MKWIALLSIVLLSACADSQAQQTPEVSAIAPTMVKPDASNARPPPGGVEGEIAQWFSAAGYKAHQIRALVEDARIESGFEPCVVSASGSRYSFQWLGVRLHRLAEFTGVRGCPPLEKQLAFADYELKNEPAYSCFWNATTEPGALAALRRGFGRGHC